MTEAQKHELDGMQMIYDEVLDPRDYMLDNDTGIASLNALKKDIIEDFVKYQKESAAELMDEAKDYFAEENAEADDLKKIADHYGKDAQEIKTIEELMELAGAIGKKESRESLIEEIADVTVMLKQLIYLYHCDAEAEAVMGDKIRRTLERMKGEKMNDWRSVKDEPPRWDENAPVYMADEAPDSPTCVVCLDSENGE